MKHVEIQTADDHIIEGSLFTPVDEREWSGALILHGWGGCRDRHYEAADLLAQQGFICLAVDLRGHGKTQDMAHAVRPSDNLADAIAAHDFLSSQMTVEQGALGVAGFSYGGVLAVLLSIYRTIRWLALRGPALYRDDDTRIRKSSIDRRQLSSFRQKKLGPAEPITHYHKKNGNR